MCVCCASSGLFLKFSFIDSFISVHDDSFVLNDTQKTLKRKKKSLLYSVSCVFISLFLHRMSLKTTTSVTDLFPVALILIVKLKNQILHKKLQSFLIFDNIYTDPLFVSVY